PPRPGRGPRLPAAPRRGVIAAVVAALLLLGVGTGVWYINSGQFTRVPPVLGQTEAAAKKRLADAGLDVEQTKKGFSDVYKRGSVMDIDPGPGKRIRDNGSVTLVISRGPEIVKVPEVQGKTLAEARSALRKVGLADGVITKAFSEEFAQGTVISSDPEAGTGRRPDSAVALVVSKGTPVDVPDVTGESVESATSTLEDAGLKVKVAAERVHSPEDAGSVATQSLAEGKQAAEGDTITLTLSKGPRMIEVPDVVGDKADAAKRELERAGFEVEVERGFPFLGDTVESQSVEGGEQAPEGSTITIKTKGI
ncbi:PASTA domain-containing protein, partial [Streptomyces sp. NPDC054841]